MQAACFGCKADTRELVVEWFKKCTVATTGLPRRRHYVWGHTVR